MKQTLLSFFFLMLPLFAANADESGTCGENLTWTFESSSGTLTISGTGDLHMSWGSFPNSIINVIINEGVTSIGDLAFSGCSSLTSISIPKGVTSIGDYAFNGCSSLTSISIPKGVTSIGYFAFNCCSSLTSIIIPEGVTSIGDYAFCGCSSLTSISIPEGGTSIGDYAFASSGLEYIVLPENLTTIDVSVFINCNGLKSILFMQPSPPSILRNLSNKVFILLVSAKTSVFACAYVCMCFFNKSGLIPLWIQPF